MNPEHLLYALVQFFENLNVRYFITGSIAAMTYGESRFTNDVDIVADIQEDQIAEFCSAFPPPEFYLSVDAMRGAIRARRQFNLLHISEGINADIIIPNQSEFNQSRFSRRRPEQVGSRGYAIVASPEDVILKKLEYYKEGQSEKHLRDIAGMLQICPYPIDHVYLELWAAKLKVLDIWRLIVKRVEDSDQNNPSRDE
jgi:hypothetical protein